jgi:hypothetical protein
VRNIKNVSQVARAVMEHTGHVMLVGEGAERFAVAQGFSRENLLTEHSRKIWLLWKETHSDWWGPGIASPDWRKRFHGPDHAGLRDNDWGLRMRRMEEIAAEIGIPPELRMDAIRSVTFPPTGTIHCSVRNEKAEMSGCTTTSGLAWKIPGRVGDSPIIGAGCYTDQEVGSAGATGSGEENIKVAGAHTIIENMRHGMSPLDAGMDAHVSKPIQAAAQANYAALNDPLLKALVPQLSVKGGLMFAGVDGGSGLYTTPKNTFLPRLGVAYQLTPKTVLRGGAGLFAGFLGERRGDVIQSGYSQTTTVGTTYCMPKKVTVTILSTIYLAGSEIPAARYAGRMSTYF